MGLLFSRWVRPCVSSSFRVTYPEHELSSARMQKNVLSSALDTHWTARAATWSRKLIGRLNAASCTNTPPQIYGEVRQADATPSHKV
jgi:hypothetical protein